MLYNFETFSQVTAVTKKFKVFFEKHKEHLSDEDLNAISDYINELIDNSGERFNPGWEAPKSWEGTPLQIIYEKACDKNEEESAYLYGLLVKEVFIERDDEWYVISQQERGRDFEQNSYFRKK